MCGLQLPMPNLPSPPSGAGLPPLPPDLPTRVRVVEMSLTWLCHVLAAVIGGGHPGVYSLTPFCIVLCCVV